ncbi:MAG: hypothetical protein EB127_27315 [Alphaproteobacteria bacterium]|jgi:hypothetical protein|nr:hypothetical protein [Alphaproteobacteria bacterium]
MVQFVEIVEESYPTKPENRFKVREIYVSPEHIIMVREDANVQRTLSEGLASIPGLSKNAKFSKLTINRGSQGQDIIVAGSVDAIYEKINNIRSKQLLRG